MIRRSLARQLDATRARRVGQPVPPVSGGTAGFVARMAATYARGLHQVSAAAVSANTAAGSHLALVALVSVLAEALALAGPPIAPWLTGAGWLLLRIPLGMAALMVLPGHALTVALFPRADDLDGFERCCFAVGLSVAHIPLLALALDRSPWGLSPIALVVGTGTLTRLWCVVAVLRQSRVPAPLRFRFRFRPGERERGSEAAPHTLPALPDRPRWWEARQAAHWVGTALLVMVAWAVVTVVSRPGSPPMTEFYILGAGGLAEEYPRSATPGQEINVTVGVANGEPRAMDYRVVAVGATSLPVLAETPTFRVESGETWSGRLTFSLTEAGYDQQPELLLFAGSDPLPYRRLRLVIDVPSPGTAPPVRPLETPVPRRTPISQPRTAPEGSR